jgi:hypothetical protein
LKSSVYLGILSITSLVAISLFVTGCDSKMITSSPSSPSLTIQETIKTENVESMQVVGGLPGASSSPLYLSAESTGKVVISKVIEWINDSKPINGQTEYGKHGYPMVISLIMKNRKTLEVEPAYECVIHKNDNGSSTKSCSPVKGEIVLSKDSNKIRLTSPKLYEWLEKGWQQDILPHSPEPKLNVTVSISINGLNDILKLLSSQKNIFNIKESPNKKYVAYMHSDTATAYEKLTLHLWRVGDPQPLETNKIEEENVGDVLWSPNSDYVFVDKGTSVIRRGDLFLVEGLKKVTSLGYYHAIYFSPDGKKILIGSINDKISTIKSQYISPENIVNLTIYDIDTNKLTTVYKGTDNEDYNVIGWLDDDTISYHLNKYSDPSGKLIVDCMKFKYDLKTNKSFIDQPKINKSAHGKDEMSIGIELGKEKDIFNETWSPDRGTVVYGKGNNNEGLGRIFMWRVGEEKPSQIVPNDTGFPIGNFSWSPNSEFFTIHIAVAPESGVYLTRVDNQKTTRVLCFMEPFFSADSKFLLFTGLENIQSVYKVAGSGVSVNISIMDLNTLKTSVLIPSTDKINYTSLGWAGTNKVIYRKYDFSAKTDEILEYDYK